MSAIIHSHTLKCSHIRARPIDSKNALWLPMPDNYWFLVIVFLADLQNVSRRCFSKTSHKLISYSKSLYLVSLMTGLQLTAPTHVTTNEKS